DEMKQFVRDKHHQLQETYFEALELNASSIRALFKLLDADKSGTVDIAEFCEGCLRLKGEARSFDINCLLYEHRRMHQKMSHLLKHVQDGVPPEGGQQAAQGRGHRRAAGAAAQRRRRSNPWRIGRTAHAAPPAPPRLGALLTAL
ncbi:unnamed protein product, partial [Prorocentrum cordatum]